MSEKVESYYKSHPERFKYLREEKECPVCGKDYIKSCITNHRNSIYHKRELQKKREKVNKLLHTMKDNKEFHDIVSYFEQVVLSNLK